MAPAKRSSPSHGKLAGKPAYHAEERRVREGVRPMSVEPTPPVMGLERGYQAIAALRHVNRRELLAIRARSTFRPIHDDEIAPIFPCDACLDGGLRVVGCVRGRGSWQRVHVCDTCGEIRLFDLPGPGSRP
jgi:hypothetical protein